MTGRDAEELVPPARPGGGAIPSGMSWKKWEGMVLAAYLVDVVGASVRSVAPLVGVTEGAVRKWRKGASWPDVVAEATTRWEADVEARARRNLSRALAAGDMDATWKVLERRVSGWAPSTQDAGAASSGVVVVIGAPPAGILRPEHRPPLAELHEVSDELHELLPPAGAEEPDPDSGSRG